MGRHGMTLRGESERGPLRGTALASVILLLAATGCASTGSTEDGPSERRDVITRQEMVEADVSNLYDVVQRLRPEWLRRQQRSFSRDTRIVVVENNSVLGDAEMLRQISPDGVRELRFMDGDTAAATLVGARQGFVEGAIIIERGPSS